MSFNKICPITQEEFEENEDIIVLPCNHYSKEDGIRTWLEKNKAICPVCRYQIKYKEERIEDSDDNMEDSDDEKTILYKKVQIN